MVTCSASALEFRKILYPTPAHAVPPWNGNRAYHLFQGLARITKVAWQERPGFLIFRRVEHGRKPAMDLSRALYERRGGFGGHGLPLQKNVLRDGRQGLIAKGVDRCSSDRF